MIVFPSSQRNVTIQSKCTGKKSTDQFFRQANTTVHPNSTTTTRPTTTQPVIASVEELTRQWMGQLQIQTNNSFPLVSTSHPNIRYYVGLYFIYEKLPNSSRETDIAALASDLKTVNNGLIKVNALATFAGFAYVPKIPSNLTSVDYNDFFRWVDKPLREIYRRQSSMGISLMVFITQRNTRIEVPFLLNICNMTVNIWWYNWKPTDDDPITYKDQLTHNIFFFLGACWRNCLDPIVVDCPSLRQVTIEQLDPFQIQCINRGIAAISHDNPCLTVQPRTVAVPICGNGLIEGNEQCDCLTVRNCPESCDRTTCTKVAVINANFFRLYLPLLLSGTIVLACSGLVISCFVNRARKPESKISIALSRSETAVNFKPPPVTGVKSKPLDESNVKSKILLDQLKNDLKPQRSKSKGPASKSKSITPMKRIFQTIKTLGTSENVTTPMSESTSIQLTKKSTNDALYEDKSYLNIMKKVIKSKVNIKFKMKFKRVPKSWPLKKL